MQPMMTPAEWEACCAQVKDAMRDWVLRFVTPISMSAAAGHGVSWGTGTYLEVADQHVLLTNNHVVSEVPEGGRLAHLPGPTDDFIAVGDNWTRRPLPIDAAFIGIRPVGLAGMREPVPCNLLEPRFSAVEDEQLFWIGYPGYTAERHDAPIEARQRMTRFGGPLESCALPMLSQVIRDWSGEGEDAFDPALHLAVHYPAKAQRTANGPAVALPHPKGMSGSLLWDTKFVANRRKGAPWSASDARVCGLVWAALDHPEIVIATKIEHVKSSFNWL